MREHLCMAVGDKEGWFKFVSCFFFCFYRLTIFNLSCSWLVLFNPSPIFDTHPTSVKDSIIGQYRMATPPPLKKRNPGSGDWATTPHAIELK